MKGREEAEEVEEADVAARDGEDVEAGRDDCGLEDWWRSGRGEEGWDGVAEDAFRRGGGRGRARAGGEGACRTVCVRLSCEGPEAKNEAPALGFVSRCLCWELRAPGPGRLAPDCCEETEGTMW